jgi:hypothetical protein
MGFQVSSSNLLAIWYGLLGNKICSTDRCYINRLPPIGRVSIENLAIVFNGLYSASSLRRPQWHRRGIEVQGHGRIHHSSIS